MRAKKTNDEDLPPIGVGTFAHVYSGIYHDPKSKSKIPVAIKTIPGNVVDSSSASNDEMRERFFDEVKNLSRLQQHHSKHVIRFFGITKHRNKRELRYSIITELGQESLADYLHRLNVQKKTFSIEEQVKLCLEIAEGLAEIHSSGLVHKDIKDTNVILVPVANASFGYTVKLVDLGLGALSQQTTLLRSTTIKDREGTVCWQAPEVVLGVAHSKSTDIFSFALLMWRILHNGAILFDDNDRNLLPLSPQKLIQLYTDAMNERPTISNDADPRLATVMKSCWLPQYERQGNGRDARISPLSDVPTRPSARDVVNSIKTNCSKEIAASQKATDAEHHMITQHSGMAQK